MNSDDEFNFESQGLLHLALTLPPELLISRQLLEGLHDDSSQGASGPIEEVIQTLLTRLVVRFAAAVIALESEVLGVPLEEDPGD